MTLLVISLLRGSSIMRENYSMQESVRPLEQALLWLLLELPTIQRPLQQESTSALASDENFGLLGRGQVNGRVVERMKKHVGSDV